MANINGEIEGTRFAHNVYVYDPDDGEILADLLSAGGGGFTPAADVADATDDTDVITQFNALLASLRNAGILE